MKKPLFASLRTARPVRSARPFRLWMTGSLAVVMTAMMPLREMAPGDRGQGLRVLRHSRYGVVETVKRIETAALAHGLAVLAVMRGEQPVLVLASSVGGTPVLMQHADSQPEMPLSLVVRESVEGGADVYLVGSDDAETEGNATERWAAWPTAVADDLQALPLLVDSALA